MSYDAEEKDSYGGELADEALIGEEVVLTGWVAKEETSGLVFIDLRDRSGIVQVVLILRTVRRSCSSREARFRGRSMRLRNCCQAPSGTTNPALPTGRLMLEPDSGGVVRVKTPPFISLKTWM